MRFVTIIILCLAAALIGATSYQKVPETSHDSSLHNLTIVEKWKKIESNSRKLASEIVKYVLAYAIRSSGDINLSSNCTRGIMKLLSGIKTLKGWAFKMLDASGKLPNGIYSGSISSLGEFDQCLDTTIPGHFQGKYCMIDMHPPLPKRVPFVSSDLEIPELINLTQPNTFVNEFMKKSRQTYHLKLRTSVCVPSVCSDNEIELITKKIFKDRGNLLEAEVSNCEVKSDEIMFNNGQLFILLLFSILLLLGVCATITDIILKLNKVANKDKSILIKCLLCFSFYTNTIRLLKKDDSPDTIKIFHGMKVITILWVILNHTYYYINFQAFSNLVRGREAGKEILFQLVINGFVNVETFFFISAVLISYAVMKMKEKKLNVFLYIFRRFWRLTPPFMFVIAFVHLLPLVGSGPLWKETVVQGLTQKCEASWWANLLYINNFLPVKDMCLEWLWYIPVDTHLYILSLIVLIPLQKNPRLAFSLNALIFIVSLTASAALNVYYGLHPTGIYVFNHPEDINYFVSKGYFRTYLHCSTYCIGIWVGYFIATRQTFHLSLIVKICGWIAALSLPLVVLYGVYDWNQGNVPNALVSTLYTCTNKIVWSLALGWVTVTCMTGNGGFVKTLLSWQVYVPFGRLTYMVYLIHPIIQYLYIGSTRALLRMDHRAFLYMYLSNITLAFMLAYGLSLLFESPFMALEKLFFQSMRSVNTEKNKKTSQDEQNTFHLKECEKNDQNEIYVINFKKIDTIA